MPAMADGAVPGVVRATRILAGAAAAVGVPVLASEQYPKGLGATVPEVREVLPEAPLAKLEFSAYANPELRAALERTGRRQVVLVGVEAHVCVLQTALDLVEAGFTVHVAADGVASRSPADRAVALDLLRGAGVVITASETAAFQWCGRAGNDAFKVVSKLVR